MSIHLPQFTVRRMLAAVAMIALVLGSCVLFQRWLANPYITVRVYNETDRPLTDVRISYRIGERKAERINPGDMASWPIRSVGESGINLTYRDSNGSEVSKDDNAYIESGYRGVFEFHVDRHGIKVVDETRPF